MPEIILRANTPTELRAGLPNWILMFPRAQRGARITMQSATV